MLIFQRVYDQANGRGWLINQNMLKAKMIQKLAIFTFHRGSIFSTKLVKNVSKFVSFREIHPKNLNKHLKMERPLKLRFRTPTIPTGDSCRRSIASCRFEHRKETNQLLLPHTDLHGGGEAAEDTPPVVLAEPVLVRHRVRQPAPPPLAPNAHEGAQYPGDVKGHHDYEACPTPAPGQSWALSGIFEFFSIIKKDLFAFFIKLITYFCTSPIYKAHSQSN